MLRPIFSPEYHLAWALWRYCYDGIQADNKHHTKCSELCHELQDIMELLMIGHGIRTTPHKD